jgi:hypothetical protein
MGGMGKKCYGCHEKRKEEKLYSPSFLIEPPTRVGGEK